MLPLSRGILKVPILLCLFGAMLHSCSNEDGSNSTPAYAIEQGQTQESRSADIESTTGNPVKIQHRTALESVDVEVLQVRESLESGSLPAEAGYKYLHLMLRITNLGEERNYAFLDSQFALETGMSRYAPERSSPEPDLGGSGVIGSGLSREGWMTFRVKRPESVVRLHFSSDIAGGIDYQLEIDPAIVITL